MGNWNLLSHPVLGHMAEPAPIAPLKVPSIRAHFMGGASDPIVANSGDFFGHERGIARHAENEVDINR